MAAWTADEIKNYIKDRSDYVKSEANFLKLAISGQANIPVETAYMDIRNRFNFILLDLTHATAVAFDLRVVYLKKYPSLKTEIENFWYFLEAIRHTIKILADLNFRTMG